MTTSGDLMGNVRRAVDAAEQLRQAGHFPYVPHLSALWQMLHAHTEEAWLDLDLEWLAQCQAVIRLPGRSTGADRETHEARRLGIPTYDAVDDFLRDA